MTYENNMSVSEACRLLHESYRSHSARGESLPREMIYQDALGIFSNGSESDNSQIISRIAYALYIAKDDIDIIAPLQNEDPKTLLKGYRVWKNNLITCINKVIEKHCFFAAYDHSEIDDDDTLHMIFMAIDAKSPAFCRAIPTRISKTEQDLIENSQLREIPEVDVSLNRDYRGSDDYYRTYWERRRIIDRQHKPVVGGDIRSNAFDDVDIYTIDVIPDSPQSMPVWARRKDVRSRWFMICTNYLPKTDLSRKDRADYSNECIDNSSGLRTVQSPDYTYLNHGIINSKYAVHFGFAQVQQYFVGANPKGREKLPFAPVGIYRLPVQLSNRLSWLMDPTPYVTRIDIGGSEDSENKSENVSSRNVNDVNSSNAIDDNGSPNVETLLARRDSVLRMAVNGNNTGGGHASPAPAVPTASDQQVAQLLSGLPAFEQMVVFDVGQGQCVGLLDANGMPCAYFDVGWGVHETKIPKYCTCNRPPIILSSWDEDHWLGISAEPKLLSLSWIVPQRPATKKGQASYAKLMGEIGANNGANVYNLSSTLPALCVVDLNNSGNASNDQEKLIICETAHTNPNNNKLIKSTNDVGVVIAVVNSSENAVWLLVADAGYHTVKREFGQLQVGELQAGKPPVLSFRASSKKSFLEFARQYGEIVAMTASHHGARLSAADNKPPTRPAHGYARLLFSFGTTTKGNSQYGHPSNAAIEKYREAGWKLTGEGWPIAQRKEGDFLSTNLPVDINGIASLPVDNNGYATSPSTHRKVTQGRSAIAAGWNQPAPYTGTEHLFAKHAIEGILS
ncbi:hypothetical protein BLI708_02215 [Bifidobacterium imperatoris]|uniref:Flagellar hook-length control protein FliK n=1 Tax=Bifidobacterium imperatoris TaxID=2020965 RepID=A0A2N5ITJ8_9BIFI|nr:hypothetical protein [Bifidobacterium imperatoris]PLS25278.1 Flagellar hook-length control protein FliK [Bifidobacterium imperatoris]QSY58156.1 hypothetical protein BLI708_02215 [Bifidobacterium imperatoris]